MENLNDLLCGYCGKECKNKNSLAQHQVRCSKNPNRKSFNNLSNFIAKEIRGNTKENCESIAKQAATLKRKYDSGYESPNKGKHIILDQVYSEHNSTEINKWLEYQKTLVVYPAEYSTINHNQGYKVIAKGQTRHGASIELLFEHDYLAKLLLQGKLTSANVVHHINKNRTDNSLENLLVFVDSAAHKRYHTSKNAYLVYDGESHLFNCITK